MNTSITLKFIFTPEIMERSLVMGIADERVRSIAQAFPLTTRSAVAGGVPLNDLNNNCQILHCYIICVVARKI